MRCLLAVAALALGTTASCRSTIHQASAPTVRSAQTIDAEDSGLFLNITEVSVNASSSMTRLRDGRPTVNRELRISGHLMSRGGGWMYRADRLVFDRVVDHQGRDVMANGETLVLDTDRSRRTWIRTAPGSNNSVDGRLTNLAYLPTGISLLAGHMDAIVVDELQEIPFKLDVAEEFTSVGQGFSYRVIQSTVDKSNTRAVTIEWRSDVRTAAAEGRDQAIVRSVRVLGSNVETRDSYDQAPEMRVGDITTGEYRFQVRNAVGPEAPTEALLSLITRTRPLRLEFELRDLPWAGEPSR